MPEQLSLPGLDAEAALFRLETVRTHAHGRRLLGYSLFLAIFPESEDGRRLAQRATDLRSLHALGGTPLPAERLHITLHTIVGIVDTIPQAVVDRAIAAAASVVCPPLPIEFDHVLSFADNQAFVLRCNAGSDAAIAGLRNALALRLRRAGLHPKPSDTPHMTMLYDHHHIPQHAITPICWTATRFALILSHVGVSHHQWITQWPLAGHP